MTQENEQIFKAYLQGDSEATKYVRTILFFDKVWKSADYKQWKDAIYHADYIKEYKRAMESADTTMLYKVYWLCFLCEDNGKRYLRYLIKEKSVDSISGDIALRSIKSILGSSWGKVLKEVAKDIKQKESLDWIINDDNGRPASSIQFKTIDADTLIAQIKIIINTSRPNAKGTDARSMHEALLDMGEIDHSMPNVFHKWLETQTNRKWGNVQNTLSKTMIEKHIPFYKTIFKDIRGTKKDK